MSSTNRSASRALAVLFLLLAGTVPLRAGADGNILLIILDDVGVDMIGAYQSIEQSNMVPPTLNIDELAAHGIIFSNAWAGPACSPTRVTIQTGQYGYRLLRRFLTPISPGTTLPEATLGIADVLNVNSALGYQKAMIGKWGLRNPSGFPENLYAEGDFQHIVKSGYDHFVGKPDCCIEEGYHAYLDGSAQFASSATCSGPAAYQNPDCILCPIPEQDEECTPPDPAISYATTENVNDALAWIADRPEGQSWFLTLSLNAAHFPFDAPPAHLTTADLSSHVVTGTNECKSTVPAEQACYRAGVEAADKEIGRLIAAVDSNETTVFVLGDNGSVGAHDRVDGGVSVAPFDPIRSKQTLYQGGINVPLIAWGKSVILELDQQTPQEKIGRRSDALVNTSDLFATILDIAGIGVADLPADPSAGSVAPDVDSYSILPILEEGCSTGCLIGSIRHYAYSEANWSDRRGKTIRNRSGYKLILHDDGFSRKVPGENPGTFDDEDITEEGLEFYYLGGDPSPLMAGLEDRRENHDLWVDEPEPGQPGELDGSRLSEPQRTYLQPIFHDLLERLGPSGQGPNLAAANKCDINLDGRIDSADILRAMQLAVSGSGEPGEMARADVAPPNDPLGGDGDGVIDSADVLLLLRAVSGDDVTSCDHTLL